MNEKTYHIDYQPEAYRSMSFLGHRPRFNELINNDLRFGMQWRKHCRGPVDTGRFRMNPRSSGDLRERKPPDGLGLKEVHRNKVVRDEPEGLR